MNMIKDGLEELWLFLKNIIHIFRLIFSLLKSNPKGILAFGAKLVRRVNETLAVFFANYRLNREDLVKNHDYFGTELKKLRTRTNGLHNILNAKPQFSGVGFSVVLLVDDESEIYAIEGVSFFGELTGNNYEVIIGCSPGRKIYADLKRTAASYKNVTIVEVESLSHGHSQLAQYKKLSLNSKYPYLVFARIQDWPRPDLLYRFQTSLELVKNPSDFILCCAEVGFFSHTQIYDVSRFTTFRSEQLPYFFMKSSCHMICLAKESINRIMDFESSKTIFQLALNASRSGLQFYTLPFELYHYRISNQDSDAALVDVLKTYHAQVGLPLVYKPEGKENPMYFPFLPTLNSEKKIHVIVLYKDNKDITLQCAKHLQVQTYKNIVVTFVDNSSLDLTIANAILEMGYEIVRVDEPFNYSRLNNLGILRSKFKDADSYLFLNNDVFLEPNAIEESVRWIEMPDVGVVGSLLTFEDGTIQHAGLFVDKVMNIYIPWEHQDIGLSLNSAKLGRALRQVEAVTGACLLMKRDVFEKLGGWDEVFYPISFSDTDLCRRVRRLGYKIIYTPDSRGVHLESKTRGYSLIEDYECSSWLFWTTELKNQKNNDFMGHHFLDIPDLFERELQSK